MNTTSPQLIETPANIPGGASYTHLAYIDAYDAVINCDYAFVAYRETDSSGDWRVRIKSSQTAGAVFEPAMIKSNARSTGAQGKAFFAWGYSFSTPARPTRATSSSASTSPTASPPRSRSSSSSASSTAPPTPRSP